MNYIELLNQFWQARRARGMSAYEADLYYYLLNECNRRMWLNPFELPTSIICAEIGISRKALVDLRNRLSQRGLISFKEGCRNTKGATYELLHVTLSNIQGNMNSNMNGNIEGNMNGNPIKKKLNKTKTIPPLPPNGEDGLVEIFEEFRLAYKGMKRGLETELADFSRKHSDWEQAVPLLMPALDREVEYKQQLFVSGQFVPSWKNLKTWLAQRCWEQELTVPEKKDSAPPAIRVTI